MVSNSWLLGLGALVVAAGLALSSKREGNNLIPTNDVEQEKYTKQIELSGSNIEKIQQINTELEGLQEDIRQEEISKFQSLINYIKGEKSEAQAYRIQLSEQIVPNVRFSRSTADFLKTRNFDLESGLSYFEPTSFQYQQIYGAYKNQAINQQIGQIQEFEQQASQQISLLENKINEIESL